MWAGHLQEAEMINRKFSLKQEKHRKRKERRESLKQRLSSSGATVQYVKKMEPKIGIFTYLLEST